MIDFKLSDEFVNSYRDKEVPWGYQDAAGNSLGEITFLRTYSRKKEDGSKETWAETCRRVIEGMFSIQKRHCRQNHIEWKNDKAQRTAKDAYDRLFNMKWLPSGRGLWAMGSDLVMEEGNSAPLQSCAFISTDDSIVDAMTFLFDASMLGVGVGFDADGADKFDVTQPAKEGTFVIPDSREGWVESLRILLASYLDNGKTKLPEFDYSEIRPAGSPIKRFGGVASGSGPLKKMHTQIEAILANRVGEKATMTDIADIGNIIGTCVVAGNVRRCLPEGTRVHLTNGIRNIERVRVGDVVETSGKRAKVTNVFDQGVQETVIVKYQGGELECTPNHQVAVFDTVNSWTFKRADELTTDDRIVWDREGITGVETDFPIYEAPERKAHDTTGQELDIPMLDAESAWFIGMVHGDGYIFMPAGKTPNGSVSVASAPDTPGIPEAVAQAMENWGVRAHIKPGRDGDATIRISAYSTRLAEYFYDNVKRPNEPINVPIWIKDAYPEVRIGYLAGLFDSDGSYKTRPLQAVVTVYPEFAKQIAELYASLGIQARAHLIRPAQGNNQALYAVDIVGGHNIRAFEDTIARYSLKYEGTRPLRSAGGATFSADMVRLTGLKAPDVFGKAPHNAERIENILGTYLPAIPYQVTEVVPSGRSVQTYDIEVEGIHQFTAEGIVVHNSAEIFFVDRDSDSLYEFLHLKDYEKNPERGAWGYMSNNSVRVSVGDDLTPLMDGIKLNGEPGVVWMDVTRNYGRLVDGSDGKDSRVKGFNPCSFGGEVIVHTSKGPKTIAELKDTPFEAVVNGELYSSPSGSYITGQKDLYRLKTVDGYEVVITDNHEVMTDAGWKEAKDITPEDKIILHNHSSYAASSNSKPLDLKELDGMLPSQVEFLHTDNQLYYFREVYRMYAELDGGLELSFPFTSDERAAVQRILLKFGIKSSVNERGAVIVNTPNSLKQVLHYFSDSLSANWIVRLMELIEEFTGEDEYTTRLTSFEFERFDKVWDLSVSTKRAFDANGLYVHNSEQPLESSETCVSGNTLITTKDGVFPIKDIVGKEVSVWNGDKWSSVTPFSTGKNSLYRVTLSDGSYLDATPGHNWEARERTQVKYRKISTSELKPGMILPNFSLDMSHEDEGEVDPLAYSYGFVAGDGFMDQKRTMAIVQTSQADLIMPHLSYKAIYPEQNFSNGSVKTYNRVVTTISPEDGRILRAGETLPDCVMKYNVASLRQFFAGWIDTDGTVARQAASDSYRIYGSEGSLRQAQVLLRRLGVNHSSLYVTGKAGDVTNMGTRNKDVYALAIPSYESHLLDSNLKKISNVGSRFKVNNAHPEGRKVDAARKQKIVSIELIEEEADTYCFTEPENGKGVFGNVLTYQCVLVETFINNCADLDDFIKTLKVAYLYGKTVTLMPTKWEKTNTVMQRNRRIGLSASGVADFVDSHGMAKLRSVLDDGFNYVLKLDKKYSEWLCIRESIRHTTMKPSGSISILAGSSPGTHWTPGGEYFIRRITFAKSDPLFQRLLDAGYEHETLEHDPNSAVILFPIHSKSKRASSDVPAWEKIHLASEIQAWWSDNGVSCTVDFKPSEADDIPTLLAMYDGKLKGISFLPAIEGGAYKHMPYEGITEEKFEQMRSGLNKAFFDIAYSEGKEAEGEKFCATDFCEIEEEVNTTEGIEVPLVDLSSL